MRVPAPPAPGAGERPWRLGAPAVAAALDTDLDAGLPPAEAARRLAALGPNQVATRRPPGPWRTFAHQLANTMTAVLAASALVALLIGDAKDTVVIAVILVLNAVVGFVQEHRAERAVAELEELSTDTATVVRAGEVVEVPVPSIVRGDLVELTAGDLVPADLRLVAVHALRVDESSLTGESEPAAKLVAALTGVAGDLVADRTNMAFKGTTVTYGRARGVVVATGPGTELGLVAALLEARTREVTPLQRRLAALGRRTALAAVGIGAAVFVVGLARGEPASTMLLTSVSLAVAAVPEGLPAIVTVSLALGARHMAERRAVIRRLPAVETLGSVTVICTDKTGTLTQDRMLVERVWTPAAPYAVTGVGYAPEGEVTGDHDPLLDPDLARLAAVAAACNDARLHGPEAGGAWSTTGDPTEGALLALAAKLGVDRDELEARLPRAAEVAFDPERRRMTTVHRDDHGWWVATKGALGALVPLLGATDEAVVAGAVRAADRLADEGYRVLALAERRSPTLTEPLDDLEHDLRLLGLVGIADPPRPGVPAAVAACRAAGITPVMITGDHPRTAMAIARRIGLLDGDGAGAGALVTGDEVEALLADDEARVGAIRVFARTSPAQKLRIVEAWKARGAVVAMTGDGVNDAPALQRADIGVAMGVTGTDVSREAADMVLADDDFATIVHAVEEGRRIHDNIDRFVRYVVTTNSAEVGVMFLAPLLGLPLPLLPVQILWVNLVTDGLPAVALGMEPADPDAMRRPPRPAREAVLAGGRWQHALRVGALMTAAVLGLDAFARAAGWPWQTMVFSTLALLQLAHALAVRAERDGAGRRANPWIWWAVGVSAAAQLATVYVPALRAVFDTEPLDAVQLLVVLAVSSLALVAVGVEARVGRRRPTGRAS